MDDFSSSLIKLRKEQEKERKKILYKKQKEKKSQESNKFKVDDYLSSIERSFIKQQNIILNQVSLEHENSNNPIFQQENKYSWILKLNLKNYNDSKFPNNGETDQVILPNNLLKILSNDESIYPLYFNIKCLNHHISENINPTETHCGVLDYSEESGYISLPNKVLRCLKINPNDSSLENNKSTIWIQITYKKLLKGSFASFEILNSQDIFKMYDIESLLESYLRNNFLTLTIGDTLMINQPNYSSNNYCISLIKVKHLEPENSISLINTDISLDIIYKDPKKEKILESNLENTLENSIRLINIGDVLKFDDNFDDLMYFKLDIPLNMKKVLINESDTENATKLSISIVSNHYYDIFVSFPPIFEASSHLYIFRSFPEDYYYSNPINNSKSKSTSLVISSTDFINYLKTLESNISCNQDSSSLLVLFPSILFVTIQKHKLIFSTDSNIISNNGESSESSTIQVNIQYCKKQSAPGIINKSSENEFSTCTNCKRKVPSDNLDLHSIQCEKMYKRCDQCDLVLKKSDLEKHTHCNKCIRFGLSLDQIQLHEKLYHQFTQCKLCNQDNIKPIQLTIHQTQECSKRIILCRYCNNFVQAGTDGHYVDYKDKYYYNLTSHESYCGSRTTNCYICNKIVLIKELKSHIDLVHKK
ncbi:ubiquitin fusion degradation (UFD1) family [Cryptosporidium sp. chipmunk genotype I]|uniref:ubiquitin fusion degradation (UFD1) family n=1 Tax=Cryptosporidium sp. chipmunk genotype I TaxID=1280935 RepID=UPI00351A8F50|nr:ubiquitin fusion degradation (UFD1) family [Cryptosporidium sp. chipmunk genotype I]